MRLFLLTLLTAIVALPFATQAQEDLRSHPGAAILNTLQQHGTIRLSPEFPTPGEEVTLTLSSSSHDLNRSDIAWYANSARFMQGRGLTETTYTAPAAGESVTVTAVAQEDGKEALQKTVTLRPAEVTLLWEAQTFAPPFYRGKRLFVPQSQLVVQALPGFGANRNNLVYTWYRNGEMLSEQSGVRRDVLTLPPEGRMRDAEVRVEVEDPQSGRKARETITIEPQEPEIVFYEYSPLYGMQYHTALDDQIELEGSEITLRTAPYFFSALNSAGGALEYSWFMNRSQVDQTGPEITLRADSDSGGTSAVSVTVDNTDSFLQEERRNMSIRFGAPSRTSPDGGRSGGNNFFFF